MPCRFKLPSFRLLSLIVLMAFAGCATLQQIQDTLVNIKRLQFKLDSVAPGSLAGINLAAIDSPAKLSIPDGLKLVGAFKQKSLPLSMTLKIDGKETISGDIPNPIEVPGTGQATIIPLQMSLDLYKYFSDQGYESLLNLALAIAGQKGSTSRLTLTAVPTVSVAGFALKYPGQVEIVDKEFTNP